MTLVFVWSVLCAVCIWNNANTCTETMSLISATKAHRSHLILLCVLCVGFDVIVGHVSGTHSTHNMEWCSMRNSSSKTIILPSTLPKWQRYNKYACVVDAHATRIPMDRWMKKSRQMKDWHCREGKIWKYNFHSKKCNTFCFVVESRIGYSLPLSLYCHWIFCTL